MSFELKLETTTLVDEKVVISGKLFNLFVEWIRSTKLSKQKLKILNLLDREDYTLLDLVQIKTKMSAPLIAYHINGNLKSTGLISAEMIETKNFKGRLGIRLTDFGSEVLEAIK